MKIIFEVPQDATKVKHTILRWAREHRVVGTVQRTGVNLYTAFLYGATNELEDIAELIRKQYGVDLDTDLTT